MPTLLCKINEKGTKNEKNVSKICMYQINAVILQRKQKKTTTTKTKTHMNENEIKNMYFDACSQVNKLYKELCVFRKNGDVASYDYDTTRENFYYWCGIEEGLKRALGTRYIDCSSRKS